MQTDSSSISPKVYIFMCLMIILITVSAKRGAEWFIYKDYYPLKERSPVLCILTNTFITVHLLLYPLIYVYNYFTRNFWDIKRIYTVLFYAVDGSIYLIYIMRAFRLVYAHEVDSSRSKTRIFKFLKHELYMALALIGVILLKVLPVIFNPNDDDSSFYTAILFNSFYTHSG